MQLSQTRASALFFIGFGALGLVLSADLTMGTVADMGPGWVPRALAIICMLIGAALLAESLLARDQGQPVSIAIRPLLLVTAMVVGFAMLLPFLGLPLTVVLAMVPAGLSGEQFRWPSLLVIAAVVAALTTALFAWALNLQIPVLPAFWGG